jgi:iron complex transport system substrate-binding protein
MIRAAGGEPVLAAAGTHSGALTWDDIGLADPDIVLVAPCGFGLDGAVEQAGAIRAELPAWTPVWALDGDAHVVRPGPRLVDGVEVLAAVLHGEHAPPDAARLVA